MANQIDITTTSLEALIQRATNVGNQGPDTAAIDAFCGLVVKEPECVQVAAKFITTKVHSLQEWEALQALILLETCMKRCGSAFHAEVGKFRFLNELIKLVSPKYLAAHTPKGVRRRVLELMHTWTIHYPRETKIKEAYDMLRKQGVVQEEPPCPVIKETSITRQQTSILPDQETSQLLQKLLQSKNPQDLQAANKLIKSMVKEDERRVEEKWRYKEELQKVVNNCSLLNEMLDSYQVDVTSEQELELIKELYTTCQNLRPVLFKLTNANSDPAFCTDVLTVNDDLGEVFVKYNKLIVGQPSAKSNENLVPPKMPEESSTSLLDLTPSPSKESVHAIENLAGLDLSVPIPQTPPQPLANPSNSLEALRDVFSDIMNTTKVVENQSFSPPVPNYIPSLSNNSMNMQCLMQMPSQPQHLVNDKPNNREPTKSKGLEELDILSETLLKQSLSTSKKPQVESEGDDRSLASSNYATSTNSLLLDDDLLLTSSSENHVNPSEPLPNTPSPLPELKDVTESYVITKPKEPEIVLLMPLGDIKLTLECIKPSSVPPYQVLDERNGISVALHLAKDCPRPDVSVFVVTTSSKNESSLERFLFQPVVPKCCRLRLLPPSSTTLPAHNPFLPPSAITQLMLIASPTKDPITLKYVVSYTMEEETFTEMGEVEELLMKEK